ncbi:MAG TPA: PAS domain S-box protein [Chthoniobacterales bacterium]|jgi:two-component system CheB/CheR fusion protein
MSSPKKNQSPGEGAGTSAPSDVFDPAATDETGRNARDGARKRRDPNEPMAVVGIGASAGGIGPLQQFFGDMPDDCGLAFVVVMHLSPEHESNLASIIQQRTAMPTMQVNERVKVQPNHIYVIPPNKQLAFEDGSLELLEPQRTLGRRVTIDLFFRTLAQSFGQRAVSIVLSGIDSDGAIGLKHVRAQGGVTIAQDPDEAEHDSMPLTAINTGMVDWVLPVAEMPGKLVEFVHNENRMQLPPEIPEAKEPDAKDPSAAGGETVSNETRAEADESAFNQVLVHLRAQTGHDFSHYKRATILRRIARRLQVNSVESVPDYLEFLRRHPAEVRALLADLLIGVTHFFRDQESFRALEANIPQLFAGKQREDTVRVWVVGCATGEEAYSIAMLLCEHAGRLEAPPHIQVFASDIDDSAIQDARDGLYPTTIEADVSIERLRQFFNKDHGRYRVKKELREKVLFAAHNILRDAPFSRVDLISCRNLLIYLNAKAQDQVFDVLHFALRPGGLLFVGGAEATGSIQSLFSPLDSKHRIYVRRSVPRPAWQIPLAPIQLPAGQIRGTTQTRARSLPPMLPLILEQAAAETPQSLFAGQERRAILFGELHLKLLEQYGPPSVVVNEAHDIVHLSESAGRYLQFSAGEPSANIFKVVHPALRIELRAALFRAEQEQKTVTSLPQPVEFDGTREMISLRVRPTRANDPATGFYLVLFEKIDPSAETAPETAPEPSQPHDVARDLEAEVQSLKQQLTTTIEKYDASNEELRASNEELQAVNEEMRSATEELETSKEELQSVNEELVTVNNELKSSVEGLSRANTDLTNLMAATQVGTVFLNRQLRIERFTPSAQKIFNLIPADLGRPISDITHKLRYPDLVRDVHRVLEDLTVIETEVRLDEDGWFLTRIAPYRTADDHIAGAVVTFVDITRRIQAEAELRASEARYRAMFEQAHVGIVQISPEGRFLDVNPGACALCGCTHAQMLELKVDDVTHPDDLAKEKALTAKLLAGEIADFALEKRFVRKTGETIWGNMTATLVKSTTGEAASIFAILDVIESRKRAELQLLESEERFRQFAENSADVFWILNAKTFRLEYVNPVYERMFGQPRKELLRDRNRRLDLVAPDDRVEAMSGLPEALAGKTFVRNYRIVRPTDGETRWIRDTGFPIHDEAGEVVRVAGVARDVTEERARTEKLRESEERLRLLIDGAPEYAMFLMDTSNHIIYWSKGAERVFGWTSDEALGRSAEMIFTPEDRARAAEEKEMAIARRKGVAPDRRWHLRKDGSRIWVDGIMHRLDDENGELRGYAKIARDATEMRNAEEQLQRAHDELEQRVHERTAELTSANEQLQEEIKQRWQLEQEILLISEREKRRIGQDLHDSLCQELAAAAFMLESDAQKLAKSNPAQARAFSEAAKIVNANVGLARDLARGLHPPELSSGGLTSALRELAYRHSHANVTCRLVAPHAVRIRDDAVILNLYRIAQEAVGNAVKYAEAREIVISLARSGKSLVLKIADDGRGLPAEKSEKGMGIDIMQHRASVIGARLTLESQSGGGTAVTCTLPAQK